MPLPCPDAKIIYNGKTYEPEEFRELLKSLPVQDVAIYVHGVQSITSAPFERTWHELALRRILKYAVDHGYAGVSWTPGEKQAERYDLSKQVNRIAVIPSAGGNRAVRIEPKDGGPIMLMVNKEGTVTPAFSSDDQFAGKNIADVVGKDVADKIMAADKDTNLTGLDLKVGGEGMHGFYDKIVPDYLNKIGKKFGAKVGTAATNLQALAKPVYRYEGPELTPAGIKALYNEIKEGKRPDSELAAGTNFVNRSKLSSTLSYIYGEMIDHGLSYNDAVSKTLANSQPLIDNFAKEMGGRAIQKTHQTVKFPFLPITPEMRSAFGEPMALFNQTRRTPESSSSTLSDLIEEAKRRVPGAYARPSYSEPDTSTAEVVFSANKSPDKLYRGINGEDEIRNIQRSNSVQSNSETAKRLGKEQHTGMTFFSDRPNVATSYVHDGGYVLELDRSKVPGASEQGAGEISTDQAVPASAITRVFKIGKDASGYHAKDVTAEFFPKKLPTVPQSMEDMVGRRINTANAEDQDLSRAAHIENGEIVAYHLTDHPDKVQDYLESGKPLHEGGRAAEHDELGPGLYASDVPNYWMGRSTGKYGFLNSLTPEQADKLADAVQDRIDNAGPGYLSKSEVETAHRYIDQFRKDHHGDTLVLLAGQPYNVDFWKPDFLKSIGIEPSKQPEAVEVRAKGNFAEVKNYLRPAEWKALKDAGFDGAWVRGGFSTEPQLVIWNRNAITKFGDWKPSADITMNQTRNAPPLFHGGPHELSVLQPGTMLTPDKAWAAGYTTKMDWNTGKEGFAGKVYEAEAPSGNNLVIDGSLHQVEDKLLQLGREIGATSGGLPGIARAVADHFGYDAIVGKRPDGKLTGAIVLREHPIAGTHDPLAAVNEAMRSGEPVAENLQSLAKSPVNTPEFRRWFGDSKVKDRIGNPKVVYHGSQEDIDEFLLPGSYPANNFIDSNIGFFFTTFPSEANYFSEGTTDLIGSKGGYVRGSNVVPVYLSIKNPKVFENQDDYLNYVREIGRGEDAYEELAKEGYDGIHVEDSQFNKGGTSGEWWIAFEPEQIKSALGNNGTFDPSNPDITMNQVRATKETAQPKIQDLMVEALRRRPVITNLDAALKDVAARGPSVVP